jgi:uncharacterized protein DUF4440
MTVDQEDRWEGQGSDASTDEADVLRATERERLRALVEADLEVARRLHADDFQLITPGGDVVAKEDYLSGVASGDVNYQVWEFDSPVAVRLHGPVALIRYRSQLDIITSGRRMGLRRYWHTDTYEKRDGHWQAVWSHATEIKTST